MIGSGFGASAMFGLAAIHQVNQGAAWGVTALMAGIGMAILSWKRAWRWAFSSVNVLRISRVNRPLVVFLILLLGPVVLLHGLDLMMPVLEGDSTMYHISAAKLYRVTNSLAYHDGIRLNAQAQLSTMQYLRYWLLHGDDTLLKLANVELLLILLLTLMCAAHEFRWPDAWVLALLFVFASPVFCWVAKIEYADLALASYFGMGAILICHYLRRPGRVLVLIAGLAFGFAAACKYQGLVLFGAALGAFVLAGTVAKVRKRQILGAITLLSCLVALAAGGWWLRSWRNTGTPFYPFLASRSSGQQAQELLDVNRTYGPGRGSAAFVLMGYYVATMLPGKFGDPCTFGLPLLLLQITVVLMLTQVTKGRGNVSAGAVFLVAVTVLYLLFWFYTGQVLRYMASLLPLLAAIFVASLRALGYRRRLPVVVTLFCAVLAAHATWSMSTLRRYLLPPPVTLAQKEFVLASALPYYRAAKALNTTARSTDRTYLLFAENARYYVDAVSYGDWFGKYSYVWLAKDSSSVMSVVEKLRREGFTYLLVNRQNLAAQISFLCGKCSPEDFFYLDGRLRDVERIFADDRYLIFKL